MGKLDYSVLDIFAEVERHTPTRLTPLRSGKQANGACPYDDCPGDDDGFIVLRDLSERGRHYYCRTCKRSGDIVKLLQDIRGYTFSQACEVLGLENPYVKGKTARSTAINGRDPVAAKGNYPQFNTSSRASDAFSARELAILQGLYPRAQVALQRARPLAYLASRGIPYELARSLGVGYIPSFDDIPGDNVTDELKFIKRWCDRLIFPLTSKNGQGFIGRALFLWQNGMDETTHKQELDRYNESMIARHGGDKKEAAPYLVQRYLKTYPAGYFHAEVLQTHEHITIVEGAFDALALIAGGIDDVVATCGTAIDASLIPVRICDVTLAYDGDDKGQIAANAARKLCRKVGITPRICTPPASDGGGKDWSERYRLQGIAGLASLLCARLPVDNDTRPADATQPCCTPCVVNVALPADITDNDVFECSVCHVDLTNPDLDGYYDENGFAYCATHWHTREQQLQENAGEAPGEQSRPGGVFDSHERFVAYVEAIARGFSELTGEEWHTIPVPNGYTLAEHVQRLARRRREQERERTARPMWRKLA